MAKEKLVTGPRWVPDTRTDNFNVKFDVLTALTVKKTVSLVFGILVYILGAKTS
jgi:hypothetical protein